MNTPTFRVVLFDFDYTLADSSQGAIECINFALAEMGLPSNSEITLTAVARVVSESTISAYLSGPLRLRGKKSARPVETQRRRGPPRHAEREIRSEERRVGKEWRAGRRK